MAETVYINGTDKILGRLASKVAKMALEGKKVVILNCEKIAITGNAEMILARYSLMISDIRGRHKGPFWPKRPDNIVRRTIKRMLPMTGERGVKALKNVEVYIGMPKEYEGKELFEVQKCQRSATNRYIYVGKLSEKIGSTGWI